MITGRAASAETMHEYYISSVSKMYGPDHLDLFYPAEYFAQYMTYITYNLPPSKKTYTNTSRGTVPDDFKFMDADAQVISSFACFFQGDFFREFRLLYNLLQYSIYSSYP